MSTTAQIAPDENLRSIPTHFGGLNLNNVNESSVHP